MVAEGNGTLRQRNTSNGLPEGADGIIKVSEEGEENRSEAGPA